MVRSCGIRLTLTVLKQGGWFSLDPAPGCARENVYDQHGSFVRRVSSNHLGSLLVRSGYRPVPLTTAIPVLWGIQRFTDPVPGLRSLRNPQPSNKDAE